MHCSSLCILSKLSHTSPVPQVNERRFLHTQQNKEKNNKRRERSIYIYMYFCIVCKCSFFSLHRKYPLHHAGLSHCTRIAFSVSFLTALTISKPRNKQKRFSYGENEFRGNKKTRKCWSVIAALESNKKLGVHSDCLTNFCKKEKCSDKKRRKKRTPI